MVDPPSSSSRTAGEYPAADRLDSWKEIAAYLKRDVTTVQRWEKREGLPVHRHLHDKMGSVYAFRAEIDAWTRSRSLAAGIAELPGEPAPATASERPEPLSGEAGEAAGAVQPPRGALRRWRPSLRLVAGAAAVLTVAVAAWYLAWGG